MKFYKLVYDDDNYVEAINVGDESIHIGACPKYGLKHPFIWKDRKGEKGNLIIDLPSLKIGDFVEIPGTAWLIKDEVAQLFEEQGFTGYELRPVRINEVKRMKKGASIPNLWQLVITGWGGIAPCESGIKKSLPECDVCHYYEYSGLTNPSALLDVSLWDGSDFFMVFPLVNYIFVTERVKEFIEEKGLKGCLFREPKDIPPFDHPIGMRTLLLYMPTPSRAKEIGEPLGIYWEPPVKGTEEYKAMREALLRVYRETYTPGGGCNIVYFEDEDGYIPIAEDNYERYKREPGVKIFKDGSLSELREK